MSSAMRQLRDYKARQRAKMGSSSKATSQGGGKPTGESRAKEDGTLGGRTQPLPTLSSPKQTFKMAECLVLKGSCKLENRVSK